MVTPIPYVGLQQMFDESAPWGMPRLREGGVPRRAHRRRHRRHPRAPAQKDVAAVVRPDLRAGRRVPARRPTTPPRSAAAATSATSSTSRPRPRSPDDFDAEREWVRDYWSALVPHAVGVGGYVNFMTEYDEDRVRNAYGDEVRAAPADQGDLRPGQRLPPQRQHRTRRGGLDNRASYWKIAATAAACDRYCSP